MRLIKYPPPTPSPRQLHCLNSVPYLGAHSKECHFSRETMAKCNFKDKENRAAMFCTKCVHIQVNKRYKEKSPVSQRQIHKKPPVFVGRIGTFVNRSAFLFVRNINIFPGWCTDSFFFFFFKRCNSGIICRPSTELAMKSKTSVINAALHIGHVEGKFLLLNNSWFQLLCLLGAHVFCG